MSSRPDARIDLSMRLMSYVHDNSDRRMLEIVIEVPDATGKSGNRRSEAFVTRWLPLGHVVSPEMLRAECLYLLLHELEEHIRQGDRRPLDPHR